MHSQVLVFHFTSPFGGCLQRRIYSQFEYGAFFAKIFNGLKLLTNFLYKAPSQMFDSVENRLRASR